MLNFSCRFVYIRLAGGLGNQLHQYFAANAAASVRKAKLIIDISGIENFRNGQSSTIADFKLPGVFFTNRIISTFYLTLRRALNHCRLLGKLFGYFQSPNLTFQEDLFDRRKRIYFLEGYFHTFKYFNYLQTHDSFKNLHLANPSEWFLELEQDLLKGGVCAIHVRLGDYYASSSHYGILSDSYYRDSIDFAKVSGASKFWVFSDEIEKCKNRKIFSELEGIRFIDAHSSSSSAESLLLMSKADFLVLANSTYSWWAGILSDKAISIFYPFPFFRNVENFDNFFPDDWRQVPASWT
jgi:hypothetical protein